MLCFILTLCNDSTAVIVIALINACCARRTEYQTVFNVILCHLVHAERFFYASISCTTAVNLQQTLRGSVLLTTGESVSAN